MKTRTALVAALFAAASVVSVGAFAADTDKAPAAEAPAKMKPHSHMQEKTGVAPPAADAKEAAPAADGKAPADKKADKKRHLHPRDGK